MNEVPDISVIIPVHNVEKYLSVCLDSLMAQNDFSNWEAICIDDGSPDRSGEILDAYAVRDPRFRIVHQNNGGVSKARNRGISLARAPYLMFVDSDDWVEPNMFRVLYDTIKHDQSDMVVCGYFYDSIHEGAGRRYPLISEYRWDKLIYGRQPVTGNLIRFITPYLFNKIFKREIIVKNSLSFEEDVSFGEDHAFMLKYLFFSESVSAIDTPLYHYRQQSESVTYRYIDMDVPAEFYETTVTVPLRVAKTVPFDIGKKRRNQYISGLFALVLHQIAVVNGTSQIRLRRDYARIRKTERKALRSLFCMAPKIPAVFYMVLHLIFKYYRQLKRR